MRGSRIATLIAFLAIATVALVTAIDRGRGGTIGATLVPDGAASNTRFIVTRAAASSKLHRGDHIEIDDPLVLAAVQFHTLRVGSTLPVRRTFPLPSVLVTEPITGHPIPILGFVVFSIQAIFISIAAVIAARGRSGGSLQLAWLFALIILLFNPATPAWPAWLVLTYAVTGGTIAVIAFMCAGDFASRFAGDPQSGWARRYRRISIGIGLVAIIVNVGVSIDSFLAPTTPVVLQNAVYGTIVCQALLLLIGLAIAYVKAPEFERQRIAWVVASLGVGIVGFVASVLLNSAGVPEPLRDYPLLLLIAMPFGCAYSILRYRLLDIAFVVNRATVFGVTSLLVLAALALVDFGLQNLLGSWLRSTGIYVQLGLALIIGISTRPLHHRVDTLVDDLFFSRRHDAERTLRSFARDVAYIDESAIVIARTVETVARAAQIQCSMFLLASGSFRCAATSANGAEYDPVERNDGAVVRLLASRSPVDLHDVQTDIAGDFAIPMFARNRLLGMLVCGQKIDGVSAYAPDELDAVGAVAHAAGLALDLLRIEELEREIEVLRSVGPVAGAYTTLKAT